jgi:ankyrin repeat protein
MKKTTKRRRNGGGSMSSRMISPEDRLCKGAMDAIYAGDSNDEVSNAAIIEMLERKEENTTTFSQKLVPQNIISNYDCTNPETGDSLLIMASKKGNTQIVKYLLEKGVNINIKNKHGNAALHMASHNGHEEVLKALLEKGADINLSNTKGNTPLHLAAYKGQKGIVEILLANINCEKSAANQQGYTPLLLAISSDNENTVKTEIIELFKSNGVNIDETTQFGYGPLHIAAVNNQYEIIPYLISNLADVNEKTGDEYTDTPLHIACRKGYIDVARILLEKGADPNLKNTDKFTPLELANNIADNNIKQEFVSLLSDKTGEKTFNPMHSGTKPGGSKRAYPPRKTRRQRKSRRRQNKK